MRKKPVQTRCERRSAWPEGEGEALSKQRTTAKRLCIQKRAKTHFSRKSGPCGSEQQEKERGQPRKGPGSCFIVLQRKKKQRSTHSGRAPGRSRGGAFLVDYKRRRKSTKKSIWSRICERTWQKRLMTFRARKGGRLREGIVLVAGVNTA